MHSVIGYNSNSFLCLYCDVFVCCVFTIAVCSMFWLSTATLSL